MTINQSISRQRSIRQGNQWSWLVLSIFNQKKWCRASRTRASGWVEVDAPHLSRVPVALVIPQKLVATRSTWNPFQDSLYSTDLVTLPWRHTTSFEKSSGWEKPLFFGPIPVSMITLLCSFGKRGGAETVNIQAMVPRMIYEMSVKVSIQRWRVWTHTYMGYPVDHSLDLKVLSASKGNRYL